MLAGAVVGHLLGEPLLERGRADVPVSGGQLELGGYLVRNLLRRVHIRVIREVNRAPVPAVSSWIALTGWMRRCG